MGSTFFAERHFQSALSAPDVPEQFRLEQRLGNSGTVHNHEWPTGSRAQGVNSARHQLFAAARWARDEDGRISPGHQARSTVNGSHGTRMPDHSRQRRNRDCVASFAG